ncbi:MAG TPA: right-handed parallel beta-helix repeat-containing protein [Methanomassiliicoccales archaeon]|nr:right-handed parallel beta-helix repeat-containing protein [Methanomassiliicoccales archaeon]
MTDRKGKGALIRSMIIVLVVSMILLVFSPYSTGAETSTPLVIEGDSGFLAAGFTGSGTMADPYVLTDVQVNATGQHHGIFIANTTKHFRIVDCAVTDAYTSESEHLNVQASGSGVILFNVSNGTIVNLHAEFNARGITVANCENVVVSSSSFLNNYLAGVYLQHCERIACEVSNNTFEGNGVGTLVEDSQGVFVKDNVAFGNSHAGISLTAVNRGCTGNLVQGNEVRDQSGDGGIFVERGTLNQLLENEVSDCLFAIRFGPEARDNIVSHSSLSNNTYGVRLEGGADLNVIVDNSIDDGTYGVYISPSQGNLVQNNTIMRMNKGSASWGIYLGAGAVLNTTLSDNAIIDCDGGIRASTTADQIITGLSAIGNSVSGSLGEGMYLVHVDDSQILNNSYLDGGSDGIVVSGCQDILLQDNIIKTNLRHGLEMRNSDDCRVNGNIFERNTFEGIYLTSGSGNVIDANAMLFNNDSGRAYSVGRVQAFCGDMNNSWYFGTGNLWSDWVSPDENEDGIVDRPYLIPSGCQDPFPLVNIPGLNITPDLSPPSVIEYVPRGQTVDHDDQINITFSEDMDQGSVMVSVNNVTRTGEWDDRTLTSTMVLDFDVEYQVRVLGQDLAGNSMTEFQWTFRTEGPNATVYGRAVDEEGNGLTGVQVVFGENSATMLEVDDDGRFSLLLAPGNHSIVLLKNGYQVNEVQIQVLPGQDMEIGDVTLIKEPEASWVLPLLGMVATVALAALILIWYRRRR